MQLFVFLDTETIRPKVLPRIVSLILKKLPHPILTGPELWRHIKEQGVYVQRKVSAIQLPIEMILIPAAKSYSTFDLYSDIACC